MKSTNELPCRSRPPGERALQLFVLALILVMLLAVICVCLLIQDREPSMTANREISGQNLPSTEHRASLGSQ